MMMASFINATRKVVTLSKKFMAIYLESRVADKLLILL